MRTRVIPNVGVSFPRQEKEEKKGKGRARKFLEREEGRERERECLKITGHNDGGRERTVCPRTDLRGTATNANRCLPQSRPNPRFTRFHRSPMAGDAASFDEVSHRIAEYYAGPERDEKQKKGVWERKGARGISAGTIAVRCCTGVEHCSGRAIISKSLDAGRGIRRKTLVFSDSKDSSDRKLASSDELIRYRRKREGHSGCSVFGRARDRYVVYSIDKREARECV